jgi:hypothetical protein
VCIGDGDTSLSYFASFYLLRLEHHTLDKAHDPRCPSGLCGGLTAYGGAGRGLDWCLRRVCGEARLLLNQFPAFIAIPAANPCDLAFLIEDLEEGFGFLCPISYAGPVPIDALQRLVWQFSSFGNVDLADSPKNLPALEAELEVTREAMLREPSKCGQQNFLVDLRES